MEFVYIFGQGWTIYGQAGVGLGAPGGGGALEVGPIFNLKGPCGYTGTFIEGQVGYPGPIGIGVSGFASPAGGNGPWGAKAGLYVGSPGGAVLREEYRILKDFTN